MCQSTTITTVSVLLYPTEPGVCASPIEGCGKHICGQQSGRQGTSCGISTELPYLSYTLGWPEPYIHGVHRRLFFCLGWHVYFLGWTPLRDFPPPKPPFQCPHPNKKGTNLLLFQIGIHLHTHQDLKLKCCRVMGQKLRYGRP